MGLLSVCVSSIELVDSSGDCLLKMLSHILCDMLGFRVLRTIYSPYGFWASKACIHFEALHLPKKIGLNNSLPWIGFEPLRPANATASFCSKRRNKELFHAGFHVRVPAMNAILSCQPAEFKAFLSGHGGAVMIQEYEPIAENYHTPMAVTVLNRFDLTRGFKDNPNA